MEDVERQELLIIIGKQFVDFCRLQVALQQQNQIIANLKEEVQKFKISPHHVE